MQNTNIIVNVDFPLSQDGKERAKVEFQVNSITVVRPIAPPTSEMEMRSHPIYNALMDEINAMCGRVFAQNYQLGQYVAPIVDQLPPKEEKPWRVGE